MQYNHRRSMMIRRICCIYFSPTENTKKLALAAAGHIAREYNLPLQEVDFTKKDKRSQLYEFSSEDFVILAAPTYAGKLPNMILPDFKGNLRGDGTPAAAMVTFGNRSFDNSLAELVQVLKDDGFYPLGGAAFVCQHAFTELLATGRPTVEDLEQAKDFALKCFKLANDVGTGERRSELQVEGDAAAPYYVPKGTDGQPAKFLKAKPLTDRDKCTNCGLCAQLCPMASINPEDVTEVSGICIKCQACIKGCPEGAKYFDDKSFLSHVAMLEQNFTGEKENRFFYIKQDIQE